MEVISIQEEEELRRRKREELIQFYIQQHEAFLKNPYVCVDAIDHLYYLAPRAKRSKRKSSYRVGSFLKRQNKKRKLKPIKENLIEEDGISKIESVLKNGQGNMENNKKSLITTEEKVSEAILPTEKFQELEVPVSDASQLIEKERIPKIESLVKYDKMGEMVHTEKPNGFSDFALPTEFKEKIQEKGEPKIESFLKKEKRKKLVVPHKQKPNRVLSGVVLQVEVKNKIQEIGVPISNVSLVIEKPLFGTDLSEKHMRLSIPVKQVLNHKEFLTPQEKFFLETRDSKNKKSQIKFNLIEPSLEESSIHLAKWEMNSSSSYVLLNDWVSVYKRNNLKVNMMVQLWSFKNDSNRWLALVVLPPDDAAN